MKDHKRLCQAIVIQSMKDYMIQEFVSKKSKNRDGSIFFDRKLDYIFRPEIDAWINGMTGTFKLCAAGMDMTEIALQEMMIKKTKAMRAGGKLTRKRTNLHRIKKWL